MTSNPVGRRPSVSRVLLLLVCAPMACALWDRVVQPGGADGTPTPESASSRAWQSSTPVTEVLDHFLERMGVREALIRADRDGPALLASVADGEDLGRAWGARAPTASASFAAPRLAAERDWLLSVIRLRGRNWDVSLEELAEAAPAAWELVSRDIGGSSVLQARTDDRLMATYIADADLLIALHTQDEDLADAFLTGISAQTPSGGRLALPPLREAPQPSRQPEPDEPVILLLQAPDAPLCVGQPQPTTFWLFAVDGRTGVPAPQARYSAASAAGEARGSDLPDSIGVFEFQTTRYPGGPAALLRVQVEDPISGRAQARFPLPVEHCLGGTWQDGERVLSITPPTGRPFAARISSGELTCGETGLAFSGELAGDRVSGFDLRVCNPAACVEAGLLPATSEVAYSGSVSADGQSVTMDWIGTRFSIEFDSGNIVASCAEATTVEYSFAIHRLEWP